jgi:16S rRNA (guanine527-N7)-methyltransferase
MLDKNDIINKFLDKALKYNQTHNLFNRNSKEELKKDVNESISINPFITNKSKILDLGSGGGFPGIITAITNPECKIYLLEKNTKKSYFLKKTIIELGLTNAFVIDKRLEQENDLGIFDLITARAFSSINSILDLTKNNSNKETQYVLLKGTKKTITEELNEINTNNYIYEIINTEEKPKERNIVVIKKTNE